VRSALRPSAPPPEAGAGLAGRWLLERACGPLDRRLDRGSSAPVCVGFSGGSDSLALLLLALAWARPAGRPVLALSLDHRLQEASAAWTERAGAIARRLGARFRALAWTGPKPGSGLPAAARRARHALLAEAARDAGAGVLLLGHTADDLLEAEWMRAAGSSVGDPREWSPSPVWPEGRAVFLLRPLLGLRRAELRQVLAQAGFDWIEDPANTDPRFARARARTELKRSQPQLPSTPGSSGGAMPTAPQSCSWVARTSRAMTVGEDGTIRVDRRVLSEGSLPSARRLLAMACVCAGGGERLPKRDRLERLLARIGSGEAFTATLSGARIEAGEALRIGRDPGELRRRPPAVLALEPGVPAVWDGRFLLSTPRSGVSVGPLQGLMAALPADQRRALKAFPPPARAALPLLHGRETVTCPILAKGTWADARELISDRLTSACGRIARESDLPRGSDGDWESGALS
jgi:tRNA(Ile)-lysidine synthase